MVISTLLDVYVFSVIWLLMTSAISCHIWSSVYKCHRVEYAFTSPMRTECGVFVMRRLQCCMLVSTVLLARGCAVSRRYINVCNSDVFSVVNMYFDHFCVLCIDG